MQGISSCSATSVWLVSVTWDNGSFILLLVSGLHNSLLYKHTLFYPLLNHQPSITCIVSILGYYK